MSRGFLAGAGIGLELALTMDRSRRLAIFVGAAVLTASAANPIRLHPKNPHYFEFQGKATALITSQSVVSKQDTPQG